MPLDAAILTRKIGPLPGWAWGGIAVGAFYLLSKRSTASSGTGTTGSGLFGFFAPGQPSGTTDTTGAALVSGYQQGFSQGASYYTPPAGSGTTGTASSAGQRVTLRAQSGSEPPWAHGIPAFSTAQTAAQGSVSNAINQPQLPFGSQWELAGPPQGQTVPITGPGGQTLWVYTQDITGYGGVGGARASSIGSRASDPHAYFHPSMKSQPRYTHFVQGVGGAGGVAHSAAVHQTAHQAGLHPARLAILNARPHKFIRVA
jgi:hypothetical protein